MEGPVEVLKKKYPIVYQKFKEGEDDVIRWIVDNARLLTKDKPPYTIVKESQIQEILPDGTHIFKNT